MPHPRDYSFESTVSTAPPALQSVSPSNSYFLPTPHERGVISSELCLAEEGVKGGRQQPHTALWTTGGGKGGAFARHLPLTISREEFIEMEQRGATPLSARHDGAVPLPFFRSGALLSSSDGAYSVSNNISHTTTPQLNRSPTTTRAQQTAGLAFPPPQVGQAVTTSHVTVNRPKLAPSSRPPTAIPAQKSMFPPPRPIPLSQDRQFLDALAPAAASLVKSRAQSALPANATLRSTIDRQSSAPCSPLEVLVRRQHRPASSPYKLTPYAININSTPGCWRQARSSGSSRPPSAAKLLCTARKAASSSDRDATASSMRSSSAQLAVTTVHAKRFWSVLERVDVAAGASE